MTLPAVLPPPPAAARSVDVVKGAWGGAWTAVYGCLGAGLWLTTVVACDLFVRLAALGAAAVRLQLTRNPDEALEESLAVLEGTEAAVIGPLRLWYWGGVALSAACVAAGIGVLRRSDLARRAALGLLAASFLHAVAVIVVWAVSVLPACEVWIERVRKVWEEVRRRDPNAPDMSGLLQTGVWQHLATDVAFQLLHATIVALLLVRLAAASTRGWCSPRGGVARSASPP